MIVQRPPPAKQLVTDPSVKAYMHQKGAELGQFVTSQTMILWMGQDLFKDSTNEFGYKIVLVLKDGTAEIRESGVSKDIYQAIDRAHTKMLAKLHRIQEQVLSQEERMNQIQAALGNVHVH